MAANMKATSMKGEVLRIEKENVINTMRPKLIQTLADSINLPEDRDAFFLLCRRVDTVIRAWYHQQFEDLLQLYALFDPALGRRRLEQQKMTPAQVDKLEQSFLANLWKVMEKSNFKILSADEVAVCKSSSYLLNLPIEVDHDKLSKKLFSKYFEDNPQEVALPDFKDEFLIFRRGVGVDRTEDYFIMQKVNMLIENMYAWLLVAMGLRKKDTHEVVTLTRKSHGDAPPSEVHQASANQDPPMESTISESEALLPEDDGLTVERVRIQNMGVTFENLFSKNMVQEPTFERMLLLYRKATPKEDTSDLGDRAIHLKHFRHVPMADMEIVLPEKKTPGLTPLDFIKVAGSMVAGLATFVGTLKSDVVDIWVALAIFGAFLGYCAKVYFTWQQAQLLYQQESLRSVYDKQLDSGRGTLLHLCDDVIQQELKEVILAYYVLMTKGKADAKALDRECEELLEGEFHEKVDFEVADALAKLEKLGIVTKDDTGCYAHQSLKRANDIIGVTTNETIGGLAAQS